MSSQIVVPVIIDTNILVPSLYRRTHLLNFILTGNLAVIWNDFIYEEAREIIERLHPHYSRFGIDYREVIALLDLILDPSDKVSEMPQNWVSLKPISLNHIGINKYITLVDAVNKTIPAVRIKNVGLLNTALVS